uniref:Uncharacterized protein n=1 Tax=Dulem virus 29 TaxID=3145747 RepID=A0AAU8AWQ7_9CAUD
MNEYTSLEEAAKKIKKLELREYNLTSVAAKKSLEIQSLKFEIIALKKEIKEICEKITNITDDEGVNNLKKTLQDIVKSKIE